MSHFSARVVSGGQMAGSKVASAVRKGLLQPAGSFPCADCGGVAIEYDHRDYNFPLQVEPVCRRCNVRRGKAIPKRWELDDLIIHLRNNCKFHIAPWAREFCLGVIKAKVIAAERATNGLITRHQIRPDIYPEQQ